MEEIPEYVINTKLAELLTGLGVDACSKKVIGKRRPNIRCHYRGLIIDIETSYNRKDAEEDARRKVEQGLVDIAIALWLKQRYENAPEQQLDDILKGSKFDLKVLVPEELRGLLRYIERGIGKRAEAAAGWLSDVDLSTLKSVIELSSEFLFREEEIENLIKEIRSKVDEFVKILEQLDFRGEVRRRIHDVLYRLYGLSVTEATDAEVIFGQAALSILLSATLYEYVRNVRSGLKPLGEFVRAGHIEGLKEALSDLLVKGYRSAIEVALEVLGSLPPGAENGVKDLVELAARIAARPELLRRDFAGRVYHEITGNIVVRKGFATFYTEVPAAHLLATLATQALLGLDGVSPLGLAPDEAHRTVERVKEVKVGDLACGSGTLLTASYSALMRVVTMMRFYHDLDDVEINDVGRKLIEDGIYGIDASRYASQITAVNLALIGPGNITKENTYTIRLGYMPGKSQAWLGSLELLRNGRRVGGLLQYIEGGLRGAVEKVSLDGAEGSFSIPEEFDLIIMNPPFTRATGRTEGFEGKRGLFGFIAEEEVRRRVTKAYDAIRRKVSDDLRTIARDLASELPGSLRDVVKGAEGLDQYLSLGQAGEGLLFLYLAYRHVKPSGVIAFVLPRNLLSGVSWFLARALLASRFHVKYVIVSSDPKGGYNFSEGTSLSEALVVAQRVERHSPDEATAIVLLLRKPRTAMEGAALAEAIAGAARQGRAARVMIGNEGAEALVLPASRAQLLENLDNWGRLAAFANEYLYYVLRSLMERGELDLGDLRVKVPLTALNDLLESIGVDRHQFSDVFDVTERQGPYPVLSGGEEGNRLAMLVRPNATAGPKGRAEAAERLFRAYAGKVLVPDRIRWITAHAVALYSETPALSDVFYAIRLRAEGRAREAAEKALVLWLNSTWGLLTVIAGREETEGAWAHVKMAQWRLMPVLDIRALATDTIERLAKAFDRHSREVLRRIPEQFSPQAPDPVRLGIDIDVMLAINPSLDRDHVERSLLELYRHVHNALGLWVK